MDRVSPQVADVLDRAADLLSEPGAWMQGNLYKLGPDALPTCFCAMGAIIKQPGGWAAIDFIEKMLPPTRPGGLAPLAAFNDAPGRTQVEVVAKLRAAASLAREPGEGDRHG